MNSPVSYSWTVDWSEIRARFRRENRAEAAARRTHANKCRVAAYFHRLNRAGVALVATPETALMPSTRERVVWADIRRRGARAWGLPEWRK